MDVVHIFLSYFCGDVIMISDDFCEYTGLIG